MRAKDVMIENVMGILTRDNGYAKERINTILSEEGYILNMTILDASDYGVPQNRKRAVFVGIKKDFLNEKFDFELSGVGVDGVDIATASKDSNWIASFAKIE